MKTKLLRKVRKNINKYFRVNIKDEVIYLNYNNNYLGTYYPSKTGRSSFVSKSGH